MVARVKGKVINLVVRPPVVCGSDARCQCSSQSEQVTMRQEAKYSSLHLASTRGYHPPHSLSAFLSTHHCNKGKKLQYNVLKKRQEIEVVVELKISIGSEQDGQN